MFNMRAGVIAGVFLLIGSATPFAQQAEPPDNAVPDPAVETPDMPGANSALRIPEQTYPCNPGAFEPSDQLEKPRVPPSGDDCEVIDPPQTGDSEIEVMPPDPTAGTMPIIEPEEIVPD